MVFLMISIYVLILGHLARFFYDMFRCVHQRKNGQTDTMTNGDAEGNQHQESLHFHQSFWWTLIGKLFSESDDPGIRCQMLLSDRFVNCTLISPLLTKLPSNGIFQ